MPRESNVANWLDAVGLGQYASVFAEHAIDFGLLATLTDTELLEIGVRPLGHRKKLLAAIRKLNSTDARPASDQGTCADGELKFVTVLFADIVASTEIIQRLSAEDAEATLGPIVSAVAEAIQRNSGAVLNRGDGVMAVFGAPIAREDHALRACEAALAAQAAAQDVAHQLRAVPNALASMRIGLNSGEVVLRTRKDGEIALAGPVVHLAARMEQTARPGSIRISRETLRLVEGAFNVAPLGPLKVKGVDHPIEAYELLGRSALSGRATRGLYHGLVRYIGRARELGVVAEAAASARAGNGRVVAVSGGPGLGKSRLVQEFLSCSAVEGFRVARSTAVSYGAEHAYQPVVELLRSYLQTEEALSGLELAERIRSVVLSRGPEFREAVTPLQALLDAPHDDPNWEALDPTDRRRRTIDAACGLLLAECRSEPLAVVFEDLHWVDEGTRLLLENLVDAIPRQPLLLLVNYRPEFVDPWIAREHHTLIKLDPLPAKAARELLDEIFGDDASLAPLKHMLVEVTGGNPLFLEESARTLIDKGSVVSAPGGELRLRGRVEELQIPPSVQSIIAARIDHRPAREKAVLQTAAVIGTQVPLSLLARLLGRPALEVRAALATLQAADFLHETEVFPEPEYRFKHVLIHDVAYNSLLKQQRRVLHGNIVKLIEELPPDQRIRHVELLADHALKAELWEKAVAYNRNAWRRAQARSLYREASVRAQLAIGAAENLPPVRENRETAVDLRFELRASLFPLAEFDTLDRRLEEALGIARSIADGPRENLALACLAVARWRAARFAEAMPLAESALRLLDQDAPDINRIMTHHSLGLASAALGRFSDARKWHGLVASSVEGNLLSREFDVSRHVALAHAFCAWYSLELGDEIEARRLSKEACSIADDLGQFYAVSHNQFVAALIAIRCGEYREAIARLGPHLERTTKDAASNLPWVASTLGWALVLAGDSMQGMQLLELAIDSSTRAVGLPYALPLINMAEAALALRALDRAGWAALTAREECLVRGEKGHETWALVLLAEIAAAQGNVPAAEGHYRVALQSAIDLKQESVVRRCRAGLTAFVNQKR